MTQPGGGVRILYFAWLRERVGTGEEVITLPEGVATVGALTEWLRGRGPNYAHAFASKVVRCAVNQDFATAEAEVTAGDEVAFFPPVTGG